MTGGIAFGIFLVGVVTLFVLQAASIRSAEGDPRVVVWGWNLGTSAYRVECDGLTLTCVCPLWRRRFAVEDVLTVHGVAGSLRASGGRASITPRTGPRCWLAVMTRRDLAKLEWFLEHLEVMSPSITIRR